MTKSRQICTAEYALQKAIDLVPITKLEAVTGHGVKHLYKLSDPREIEKNISYKKSLLIDALCYGETGTAPFHEVSAQNIAAISMPITGCVTEYALRAQAAVGELSVQIAAAMSVNSPGGSGFTANELQRIMQAIEGIDKVSDTLKAMVAQHDNKR